MLRAAQASLAFLMPIRGLTTHRTLIWRLIVREWQSKYRGALLGIAWAILTPLLMVGVYAFVFSYVFQPRWIVPEGARTNFVILLYSGILIFGVFSECIGRAPNLILENASYVKKVVFPLGILPVVAMGGALFNFALGFAVMQAINVTLFGLPPITTLLLPVVLLPLILFTLGLSWILAALGVYNRDLRHVVVVIVSLILFLSPIFYSVSAFPAKYVALLSLNPMTWVLETSKQILFWGELPAWRPLLEAYFGSGLLALAGYLFFTWLRSGFADVI